MRASRVAILVGIGDTLHYTSLKRPVDLDLYGNDNTLGLKDVLSGHLGSLNFDRVITISDSLSSSKLQQRLETELSALGSDTAEATLLLYFTGHGALNKTESEEDQFIYVTRDTELEFPSSGLSFRWVLKRCARLKMGIVVIVDCCFGGAATLAGAQYASAKSNFALFASSSPDEQSYLAEDHKQSAFTRELIRLLRGREPRVMRKRSLDTHSLAAYIRDTLRLAGQNPVSYIGSEAIGLSRPHYPLAASPAIDDTFLTSVLREYVEGRCAEYDDFTDLLSDKYFIHTTCQCFVVPQHDNELIPDEPAVSDTLRELSRWAAQDTA